MTRKISISTMTLGLLGAAFAAAPAAVGATGALPSPDTYLAQTASIGQGETGSLPTPDTYLARQTSADPAEALPTPDTYLAQLGGDSVHASSGPVDVGPGVFNDGFDWLDAAVGGLVALVLMLLAFAGARRSRRLTHAPHESRA